MRTGEGNNFIPDETTIEDIISEICARYKGVKHIIVKKSILDPFGIDVRLEGILDGVNVGQQFTINTYPLLICPNELLEQCLSREIDYHIVQAELFSKGGPNV